MEKSQDAPLPMNGLRKCGGIMEFYLATKKNKILSFTSKWMELENIILSEVSQAQKAKIICSLSYADNRHKTNAVILLDMGYTLRQECAQEK
jgi:hypothetical protein